MDYVHLPHQPGETIAAIATPPGEGGVAIIRISGKQAIEVAAQVCTGRVLTYPSHVAKVSKIVNAQGQVIDEALVLVMRAPRSYTGEETVELHCHGGKLISQRVLEAVLAAGALPARPGEFTLRAFMNGKLDLSQAEAVQQLIHAKNNLALQSAKQQLEGRLSEAIRSFQHELTQIAAVLEAWVDFPEEGLEFMSREQMLAVLEGVLKKMRALGNTFHDGKLIHQGVTLCLIGPPNAGKSSLMNALLGKAQAIVTEIPGTTRDVLEAEMKMGDLHVRLCDTAGIRETLERVEQEGVRRSKEAMAQADVILLVLDSATALSQESIALMELLPRDKTLLVWNKTDLPRVAPLIDAFDHVAYVSAKESQGLESLKEAAEALLWRDPICKEEVVITSSRHYTALMSACEALQQLIFSLQQEISAEFVASDMRATLNALGTIIGTNVTEEILSAIFSKFCVGK